jgi:hypothetical protein
MIMEIKYSDRMPLWLIKIIRDYDIKKQSFSKYGTEFKKYTREKVQAKPYEIELPLIPPASEVAKSRVTRVTASTKKQNKTKFERLTPEVNYA